VIYEHEELLWNDVDRIKLLIRPPELSGSLAAESSGSKHEEPAKDLPCEVFLLILATFFLHMVKYYDMEPTALLPLRRKTCCGFYHTQKSIASAGFEPANLGSNSKYAKHYSTEDDFTAICFAFCRRMVHGLLWF
jgi:hypothetical protein